MVLRALSKCLLNTDRLGASTTSLGSLFQGLTTLSEKSSAPPSPPPLLRKLQRATRSPLSLLFSRLDKPRVLSHSSQDMPSSPVTSSVALRWTHSRTFTSFLNGGAQNCTQRSRGGHTSAEYSGMMPSLDQLVVLCLMHPRMRVPQGFLVIQGKRTDHDHPVQLPDRFRADQKLKHGIKGIVQMPLKHWQAWGIDHLSRKPVPGFDHPLGKEMLPKVQSEPPLAQL
ncbi:hypothetical protein QYF61_011071 [Mycteria americana]|uniref:Uncharacterized protein n=1 Tax=Mycteria americana TaxID=33587 RepID=A0AAN7S2H8_MYCAM|nr:hypothetical protein QYF61_011071 [Mycteria americana]